MRVAYVCADHGVPVFGTKGCSIHLQEVIRTLIGLGAKVHLFASSCEGRVPSGLETVEVFALPHHNNGAVSEGAERPLAFNSYLHKELKQHGPFDLIYERYSLWSFAAMEYAHYAGIPGILEVNSPLIEEQAKYRKLENRAKAEQVAQRVFQCAKVLLAVSSGVAEYLSRFKHTQGRVHVVPNGVNPARFPKDLKPTFPAEHDAFTVGFVGTLKPWHGLSYLVEAFAILHRQVPNSRLLIVGDGPEKTNLLHHLSGQNLLTSVHFTGAVTPEDVPGWLASMDVAVAPYPLQEQFYFSPLKVYEYMAAGLPVVASRIGQLSELIQHEYNGLLTPPGNTAALASALHKLIRNPSLRLRCGRAARATVLPQYSWERIVGRILSLVGMKATQTSSHEGKKEIELNGTA